jgi:ketosteroid isomerase-like protein
MRTLLAAAVLAVPTLAPAADTAPIAAEVERGVAAYNAQQIAYYEEALATDAVYIAEDGATFVGKEPVLRLFTRIFGRPQPPRLAVTDVVTGGKGEAAWARFKWTLTSGAESRQGVTSILFSRAGDAWQVLQIQSTPAGHAKPAGSPSPGASPTASPKH